MVYYTVRFGPGHVEMRTKKIIPVSLREFPYPYKCCLSICSDIDFTNTCAKFRSIQSFMKDEAGIEFTNTFFPFFDKGGFSFFSDNAEDRKTIRDAVLSGEIDAIQVGDKFCPIGFLAAYCQSRQITNTIAGCT